MNPSAIPLPYGDTVIALEWPAACVRAVLAPRAEQRQPLAPAALRAALEPLAAECAGVRSAAIVVPDITREAAVSVVLPPLLELLDQAGIGADKVRLLFALGIHRPLAREEQARIVGSEAAARVALYNHDAHDAGNVLLGFTSQGIAVRVSPLAAAADLVLLLGTTTFHYMAGYGGGRKLVVPGVAAYETALAAHRLMLAPSPAKGWHPRCRPGVLEGNPVHEAMREAAAMLPRVRAATVLLDARKQPLACYAGAVDASLAAAIADYDPRHRFAIERRAPVVVASAGGHPRDLNVVQAHKALAHARQALARGGILVLVACCREGWGHPTFARWFDLPDIDALEARLRSDAYEINGQTAYSILRTTTEHEVLLLSSLPDADVRRMRMTPIRSLEEARRHIERRLGEHWDAIVMPYASATLPDAGD